MMDAAAIGVGLLVASAVALYVAWPWLARPGTLEPELGLAVSLGGSEGGTLAKRREAILAALRDLDFDHGVGKVAEEDYGPLRQVLLAEAADVVSLLDEEQAKVEADLDARIEAEVLSVRQILRAERDDNVCPTCGRPFSPGDLFCAGCGARLSAACAGCGRAVRSMDLFCTACGAELALAASG